MSSDEKNEQKKVSPSTEESPQTKVSPSTNESILFVNNFSVQTKAVSSHLVETKVKIPTKIIKKIYGQAVKLYSKHAKPQGLKNITLPNKFVEEEHAKDIKNNVKKFVLKHLVLDHLLNQISNKKIPIANHPRLTDMNLTSDGEAEYTFDVSVATPIQLKEWKLFTFKAPKRKKYKDLDKQVDLFIKREQDKSKAQNKNIVENNDWVSFDAVIVDDNRKPILCLHKSNFWVKINTQHVEKPFQKSFMGKSVNDTFLVNEIPASEEISDSLSERCNFLITIKSITKGSSLSVDAIKTIFRLKNKSELHNKLIEVFSYRNDISQRRSIVEEIFHLFFSKHRFEIPKHLTIRKKESLLEMLRKQPDYQVYKSQKDFGEKIETLAEKLLKEEILIDQISYKENIKANKKDINNYLTLFNNNRLREFVYFKPTFEPIEDSDIPLSESFLKLAVQREKTLNHIIYTLMV